jgi:predicted RNA-binding protein with PIN domain
VAPSAEEQALPAEVRQRLLTIAADVIGRRPVNELPSAVRRFARFTPAKRVRLGAAEIAAALAVDAGLRESVAEVVSEASPELFEQVMAGEPPVAADPADVGVIAYVARPDGWQDMLETVRDHLASHAERKAAEVDLDRLRSELDRMVAANAELVQARGAARMAAKADETEHAAQVAELQRRLRAMQGELRAAQRAEQRAADALAAARAEQERMAAADSTELRKARSRIAALEAEIEAGRRIARTDRDHDDARLWLLLEQISAGAAGLRRELDVSSPGVSPADAVTSNASDAAARPSTLDGALLDRLLDGRHVHLIVDGYNLTKTGYGNLPLAGQRARLVSSLGALAARTQVEVTVAFDGTAAPTGAAAGLPTPRAVRVLFSPPGQLADDLIRDLLRMEPEGRTVVVASSDQAVAASARGSGAWSVPAAVLLSRLERG